MTKPLSEQRLAHRKELADALRSGDYRRTSGTLERRYAGGAQHCCLGLACRVAEKHRVKVVEHEDSNGRGRLYGDILSGAGGAAQPNVARYYGFTMSEQRALARMNDAARGAQWEYSWDEIAADIETGRWR